jgi:hypothetical protein
MRMNRRHLLQHAPLLGLAGCLPTLAQDAASPPAYNIELIIFRTTSGSSTPENWAAESSSTGEGSVAGAETPQGGGAREIGRFLTALPASAYQLGGIETKLRTSGAWQPVAHVAWSQTASTWGTRGGFPVGKLGIEVPGLTGNVFLERGQFLHLGMALSYAVPNPPAGLQAPPGTVFTINESRRVKFYESTYFDHPAFGVIAMVAPAQGKRPPGR